MTSAQFTGTPVLVTCDTLVVGAGVVGSATAYSLRNRGVDTVLLEQFTLPHSRGSSHGQSRIIRKAYNKTCYSDMMAEAYHKWEQLEREQHVQIYKKTGLLCLANASHYSRLDDITRALDRSGGRYERLTAQQINHRYPAFCVGEGYRGVYEEDGGILKADRALHALQRQYKSRGGVIHDGMRVVRIQGQPPPPATPQQPAAERTSDVIKVYTRSSSGAERVYEAQKVVICAGAWTNDLLAPLGVQLQLKPVRVTVTYWPEKKELHSLKDGMPCFISLHDDTHLYGLPAEEYYRQLKIAAHYGPEIHPDARDVNLQQDEQYTNQVKDFAKNNFPHLASEPAIYEKCIYTMTPDEDFYIDRLPNNPNIVIGAGFSGHGFKMAPVVGAILADLSQGRHPSYDISSFTITRFTNKPAKL